VIPMEAEALAAHRLAGYLTGTHSGAHTLRSCRRVTRRAVVEQFQLLGPFRKHTAETLALGGTCWEPGDDDERELHASLVECLKTAPVIDLVLFGSLARGTTTGYSDVDAILVVADDVPTDGQRLARLRPRILAAQRAVLAYQPMQHHGFLVVTPRLLLEGAAVLGLPVETLTETRSLLGGAIEVGLDGPGSAASAFARFDSLRRTLQEMSSWPAHTWWLHRAVAMFELAPALYLEACGQPCPKHASFDIARRDFPDAWPAYDVLEEVRRMWIRQSSGLVRCGATLTRNPWTTVAALRRIPIRPPHRITELLSDAPPDDLKRVVSLMAARVGKNDRELAHA